MNSSIRHELDDRWEKRLDDQRAILWGYYKDVKLMCNEDARDAVNSHFKTGYRMRDDMNIFELTRHWSDLNNER